MTEGTLWICNQCITEWRGVYPGLPSGWTENIICADRGWKEVLCPDCSPRPEIPASVESSCAAQIAMKLQPNSTYAFTFAPPPDAGFEVLLGLHGDSHYVALQPNTAGMHFAPPHFRVTAQQARNLAAALIERADQLDRIAS